MNQQISKSIDSGNKGSNEVLLNAMGTAEEIATLIKCSPKCESIIWELKDNVESEDQEDINDSRKDGLLSLCHKIWTVRGSCSESSVEN